VTVVVSSRCSSK